MAERATQRPGTSHDGVSPDLHIASAADASIDADRTVQIDEILAFADARDRAAEGRDRAADVRETGANTTNQQAGLDRSGASLDRDRAAEDRAELIELLRRDKTPPAEHGPEQA
jgi:hypothetical protein